MKPDQKEPSDNEQISQPRRLDLIAALEQIESKEKARLRVTIPHEAAEGLERFLEEKGLPEREGIVLLISYGLSDESEEELEKLRLEKETQVNHLFGTYCIMKFHAYEYFKENNAMTMGLSSVLSRNRLLKKRMTEEGLQSCISQDEWDNWDEAKVNEFFRKYVFINRG